MKKKRVIMLVLQALCVVLIVGGVFFGAASMVKLTPVYVFKSNLSVGEVVSINDITTAKIPRKAINSSFVSDKSEIVGKMIAVDTKAGDYVLSNLLIAADGEDKFAKADLAKMRKISFPVKMDQALAGNISKGDIVDLLYVATSNNAQTGAEFTYSKIFMQGVYVWGVSTSDGYSYTPKDGSFNDEKTFSGNQEVDMSSSDSGGDFGELSIVTVAVTASQAEEIATRTASGNIQVVGRFANGDDVNSTGYVINNYSGVYSGNENPEMR